MLSSTNSDIFCNFLLANDKETVKIAHPFAGLLHSFSVMKTSHRKAFLNLHMAWAYFHTTKLFNECTNQYFCKLKFQAHCSKTCQIYPVSYFWGKRQAFDA